MPAGSTSTTARSPPARTISPASSPRGQALFGAGTVDEWRRSAAAARATATGTARPGAPPLEVDVERERARAGAWYELFPRSWGGLAGVTEVVPELAELGFDVLYLPPIHPIGRTNRKGRNNAERAAPGDVGSPWAIGAAEGGHDAIDPGLGTEADLAALVAALRGTGWSSRSTSRSRCRPTTPGSREHPEWFQHRPDGSLKYAENPPKRYQDIHNLDWDTARPEGALEGDPRRRPPLVRRRRDRVPRRQPAHEARPVLGVADQRGAEQHPETVFLSEAFTRPAMMTLLAKAGFSQSYTYFTWKNTKAELVELVEQLRSWSALPAAEPVAEHARHPPRDAPDGGRPAFELRLVLAATLSPSYGIYSGYEACENVPVRAGSEEYLDSEKYEVRDARARRAAAAARPAAERDPARASGAHRRGPRAAHLARDRDRAPARLRAGARRRRRPRRRQPRPVRGPRRRLRDPGGPRAARPASTSSTGSPARRTTGAGATTSASARARRTSSRCADERATSLRSRRGSCDRDSGRLQGSAPPQAADRAAGFRPLRILPGRGKHERRRALVRVAAGLVQDGGLLRAAHARVLRLVGRRDRATSAASGRSSTTSSGSGSTASGSCRSTPRPCATAATTSRTSSRSRPEFGTRRRVRRVRRGGPRARDARDHATS